MSSQRRHLRNLGIAQVLSVGSSTLVTFATASLLGATNRGSLALIIGIANLVAAAFFCSLQVGATTSFRSGDESALRRALFIGAGTSILSFLTVSVLAIVAAAHFIHFASSFELMIAAIGAALATFNLVAMRILQGVGDSTGFMRSWAIQAVIYTVVGIPVAILFGTALPVIISWFAALAASTAYAVWKLPHDSGTPTDRIVSARRILGLSLASHVGILGTQLLYRADIVILGMFASRAHLGVYSVAVPIASLTWLASEALSLAAFGHAPPDLTDSRRWLARLIRLQLVAGATGSSISIGIAFVAVPWLLPTYNGVGLLVILLLPGIIIQGISRILVADLSLNSHSRILVTIGIASAVLSCAYFPACKYFGAPGAALASSCVYFLQTGLVLHLWRRRTARKFAQVSLDL